MVYPFNARPEGVERLESGLVVNRRGLGRDRRNLSVSAVRSSKVARILRSLGVGQRSDVPVLGRGEEPDERESHNSEGDDP